MNVKLQIYFKSRDGQTYKRIINYANPDASEEVLYNFVDALNNLTNNELKSVLKIVNTYLDEAEQIIEDEIADEDIAEILDGDYIEVFDSGGITQIEINEILDGTYEQIADSDGISDKDIAAILANWD